MNTSDDVMTQVIMPDEMHTQSFEAVHQWWADTDPSIPVCRPRFSTLRFQLQMRVVVCILFIMSVLGGIIAGGNS